MSNISPDNKPNYTPYFLGFLQSIVLTLVAFYFVEEAVFEGLELAVAISVLAVGQLLIQLFFFLHLGKEAKPRWNLSAFLFMLLVVAILVIGSLWIMTNLNYTHSQNENINDIIMEEENIYK